jgi:hypothetical protein
MVRTWTMGLLFGAVVLVVIGALLYAWSVVAGIVVHVLAAVLLFLMYRLRKQGSGLVEMSKALQ